MLGRNGARGGACGMCISVLGGLVCLNKRVKGEEKEGGGGGEKGCRGEGESKVENRVCWALNAIFLLYKKMGYIETPKYRHFEKEMKKEKTSSEKE